MSITARTAKESADTTHMVWNLFYHSFGKGGLTALVRAAGVVPENDKKLLTAQAVTIWFHGSVPNIATLDNLTK